jgi:hypothetical protein
MANKKQERWRTIGEVCVDTATIVICDPCQVDEASEWRGDGMFGAVHDNGAAELKNDHDCPIAVAVSTGIGDGRYKVEARYINDPDWGKRVAEIRIKFLPHPYFDDEDDLPEMAPEGAV